MVVLEHAYAADAADVANSADAYDGQDFIPKIPPGIYDCVRGKHRLESMTEDFETFEITGVAGHKKLLFHWGNYNDNSDGCNLTGEKFAEGVEHAAHVEMVTNSQATFKRFLAAQEGLDSFKLTVEA